MRNLIAITPGEPAGIGPDIVLSGATELLANKQYSPVIIADKFLLIERAKLLGLNIDIVDFKPETIGDNKSLHCLHTPLNTGCTAGKLDSRNSQYVLSCLTQAAQGCIDKKFASMVTGPIHKGVINDSGIAFSGHTEFLAELDQSSPVMMLATRKMKVALATTHLPLKDVSAAITSQSLERVIQILNSDLKNKFSIPEPRILVLGLNPHAGEDGHLGREEIDTIIPVLEKLRKQNLMLTGPVPGDTAFSESLLSSHDAVLSMFHDQGLPVLKFSGFGDAVNITLGLSFLRTSVDHGTALDIAGTGKASHTSLLAAYDLATGVVNV